MLSVSPCILLSKYVQYPVPLVEFMVQVLPQEPVVVKLLKKAIALHGSQKLIAVFTKLSHWTLPSAGSCFHMPFVHVNSPM
jgi:hypothetical protein